ncbi:short chain dehydrogenase [Bifidobacterium actinocoloniiforme DSM 22766]|uniref:Short chain dehydrogenase n=1 Tax=Bifidobacterium actinocoloniiforme DSM 22766 TaxID=1437605 RepID=A0A086Z060_9BIFI|nr:oxidoreductase [Bifidobacterium actinocoloniiforme]AKV55171.1 short-chain dehydrogenase [Bifidobacterium actinocoloniiforme DSM 22766]KFI39910.1 short chain dehydrogenase [Bifidobacterium actinocoloniiforme DSM 22766]
MSRSVVLITGATSGIGLATARMLAERGYEVYGAGRRIELLEGLRVLGVVPVRMDMSDQASIEAGAQAILEREGSIDVLINNAGYGSYGPVEQVPIEEVRRQFEVNLFGLARLTQLVLPGMRAAGRGRVVNTSSMAGRMVTYMGAWYHATKYALEAFSDALRMETRGFGIDVVVVEPGAVATQWGPIAADHLQAAASHGPYSQQASRAAAGLRKLYASALITKPEAVARTLVHAATVKRPRARYTLGFGAKPLVALHALLPARAFDWMMVHAEDL